MASHVSNLLFDYDTFRSLHGSELVDYMEPLLCDAAAVVPAAALTRLASDVAAFDEYHAVYALELGMQRSPAQFALVAARCLPHECQSVRLAAHRTLLAVPKPLATAELIEACERALGADRAADVSDILEKLRRKQRT
jgi:hypothetical protein